jgi:hypothetical protein
MTKLGPTAQGKLNDDEALERGAEAGWALGFALICPARSEVAIKAAIAALEKAAVEQERAAARRDLRQINLL